MSVVAPPITARDAAREATGLLTRLHDWVVTVDHKRLGIMYVVSGLVFFLIAGLEAGVIRWQLAVAENTVVSPQVFNRLFTVHGTTMVFLVGIPIVFGFANYLVPLMIGARDLAFPRLNAFGFWVFLFGGLLLYFSFLGGDGLYGAGSAPDVGWFAYAPLTARAFGAAIDLNPATNDEGDPPDQPRKLVTAMGKAGFGWGGVDAYPQGATFRWNRAAAPAEG